MYSNGKIYQYAKPSKEDPDLKIFSKIFQLSSPYQHRDDSHIHIYSHTFNTNIHSHTYTYITPLWVLGPAMIYIMFSEQVWQTPIITNLGNPLLGAPSGSHDLLYSRYREMKMRRGKNNNDVKC